MVKARFSAAAAGRANTRAGIARSRNENTEPPGQFISIAWTLGLTEGRGAFGILIYDRSSHSHSSPWPRDLLQSHPESALRAGHRLRHGLHPGGLPGGGLRTDGLRPGPGAAGFRGLARRGHGI